MYVLACPCISDPSLRARGITSDIDRSRFSRALERCSRFGIEVVLLPCIETLCCGRDRDPGGITGRLDTEECRRVIAHCDEEVRKSLEIRGSPLALIGVNSSPTCGVTEAWTEDAEGRPVKCPDRGLFLARFPEIQAIDVGTFARYRVYLAAPLFSAAEKAYNLRIRDLLIRHFFSVYLPQEIGDDTNSRNQEAHREIFRQHREALNSTDVLVAVIDGADADSGTSWEMGYAFAKGIPIVALRTDFRYAGLHERVNLMLEYSSVLVTREEDLPVALHSPLT
jgi:nucleoside 2-deoxyribosyltransferase/predicted secreted protein